jgi:hypothetical protein
MDCFMTNEADKCGMEAGCVLVKMAQRVLLG